jgi:hypothetical protein
LYQRLANNKFGHVRVTVSYGLAAAVGGILAILLKDSSDMRIALAICCYVLAVMIAWKLLDNRDPQLAA